MNDKHAEYNINFDTAAMQDTAFLLHDQVEYEDDRKLMQQEEIEEHEAMERQAESDEDRAYAMFEEGWTIPTVVEEVGITYEQAERISDRQLHDHAMERHDPANCPWCRERMAGDSRGSRRKVK
jgi:hypothetical protein